MPGGWNWEPRNLLCTFRRASRSEQRQRISLSRHPRQSANRARSSSVEGRLELRDVELLHSEHLLKRPIARRDVVCRHPTRDRLRDDLPGDAVRIEQALGLFGAVDANEERDARIDDEDRAAVERGEALPCDLEPTVRTLPRGFPAGLSKDSG